MYLVTVHETIKHIATACWPTRPLFKIYCEVVH